MRPSIVLVGGLGDFFALDRWLPKQLHTIFYATPKAVALCNLISMLPAYDVAQHCILSDKVFTFKESVSHLFVNRRAPEGFDTAEDWSSLIAFNKVAKIPPGPSSLFTTRLAPRIIEPPYMLIHPASLHTSPIRSLITREWRAIQRALADSGLKGVVVGTGNIEVPADPNLINLTNITTLAEAIELAKGCKAYMGVDSCFSIIASMVTKNITVVSHNPNLITWQDIWYPDQASPDFIRETLH